MINLLQKALQDGTETIESLEQKYAIKAKRHKEFPNIISFKYDQINSPMHEPIVGFARGHILDESNNWTTIAWPFQKFWNIEEQLASPIDWDSVKIQEKLDGSLAILYYYKDAWRVATSGTPDASGNVNGAPITFCDLFWKTWLAMELWLPTDDWKEHTFMLELMTPLNRIVVRHERAKIALIGVRNNRTGEELPLSYFYGFDWPIVREFKTQTKEELRLALDSMNGIDQEGFVLVDQFWQRVKMKADSYVILHHMRGNDGPTPKKMLELVLNGEASEVLSHFPEWREVYEPVEEAFRTLVLKLDLDFVNCAANARLLHPLNEVIPPAQAQKEFASFAVKTTYPPAMFALRAGKVKDMNEFLRTMHFDRLFDLLELK